MMFLYFCASDPEKSEKQRRRVERRDREEECNRSISGSSFGPGGWLQHEPCAFGVAPNLPSLQLSLSTFSCLIIIWFSLAKPLNLFIYLLFNFLNFPVCLFVIFIVVNPVTRKVANSNVLA